MYLKKTVEFVLSNYWDLRGGRIPHNVNSFRSNNNRSTVETISIWLADIDQGIDRLDQRHLGKWLSITNYMSPARLEQIVHKFSGWQQSILKYYLLGQEDERWGATGRVIYILRQRINTTEIASKN